MMRLTLTLCGLAIILAGCSFFNKKEHWSDTALNSSLSKKTKIEILFWGNLESSTEGCECSLFPMGGSTRRSNLIAKEKLLDPNLITLNFGSLFDRTHKVSTKQHQKILDYESKLGSSALYMNSKDMAFIHEHKLKFEKSNDMLFDETAPLFLSVNKLKVFVAPILDKNSKIISGDLAVFLNTGDMKETESSQAVNLLKTAKIPSLILGNTERGVDDANCYVKDTELFCFGTRAGRSVAKLVVYLSPGAKNWIDLGNLRFNVNSFEFSKTRSKDQAYLDNMEKDLFGEVSVGELENSNLFELETLPVGPSLDKSN